MKRPFWATATAMQLQQQSGDMLVTMTKMMTTVMMMMMLMMTMILTNTCMPWMYANLKVRILFKVMTMMRPKRLDTQMPGSLEREAFPQNGSG